MRSSRGLFFNFQRELQDLLYTSRPVGFCSFSNYLVGYYNRPPSIVHPVKQYSGRGVGNLGRLIKIAMMLVSSHELLVFQQQRTERTDLMRSTLTARTSIEANIKYLRI